jgi:GMP reductase
MRIEQDTKLDFHNVLIRPKRTVLSSRSEVSLERNIIKFPYSCEEWNGVPIIAANMDTIGTFNVYNVLSKYKIITALHKHYNVDDYKNFSQQENFDANYFMISTGIRDDDFEKLSQIINIDGFKSKWICIDVANGYMEKLVQFCIKVRARFPKHIIVAGNVVSREMTEELIINGKVDVVKVGIGPGSACTTRLKTGVGMPQLSAIIECADAAHGAGGFIIGDGGITCPGDMSKAFGGGADFVMCGGVFSGHDENPGEIIEECGKHYKLFYGMSSEHAMVKHYGEKAKYRSSEGRVIKVSYKGSLINTVEDYLGGLRSCCTYINAKCIKNIPKCTTFIMVTQQLNTTLVS